MLLQFLDLVFIVGLVDHVINGAEVAFSRDLEAGVLLSNAVAPQKLRSTQERWAGRVDLSSDAREFCVLIRGSRRHPVLDGRR